MAFNYDSRWFLEAPQQRLSNISDNLLNSLRNSREEVGLCFFDYQQQITNNLPKAIDRPLIFIGHSFGGNLIEQVCGLLNPDLRSAVLNIWQAIVSSRLHSEYRHIAESTVGVIFLGTPHRGSEAAKWGVLIASLEEVWGSTEKRILKDLQKQSGTLTDRLHDFSSWLFSESVPVVCYWEQLETDYSPRARFLGLIKSILKEMVRIQMTISLTSPDISRLWMRLVPALTAIKRYLCTQITSRSTNSTAKMILLSCRSTRR